MQTLVMNVKVIDEHELNIKVPGILFFVWMLVALRCVKGLVMEVEELGVGKILDVSWIDVDFAGDFDEGWVLDRLEVAV